jgi:PEP-CTERM motif-containing protein
MIGISAVSRIRPGATVVTKSSGWLAVHKRLIRNAAAAAIGVTVVLGALTSPAAAQQVAFTGNGTFDSTVPTTYGMVPGDFSFSFLLDQNPTPSLSNADLFNFASATGVFTQFGTATSLDGRLTFFFDGGGFTFCPTGQSTLLDEFGPLLFTGPTSSPTFTTGTYTDLESGNNNVLASASITSTPEPGSMALLGSGLIGLLPIARKKRKV